MVKIGEQIRGGKLTRTQRVLQKQELERERRESARELNALQSQAEQVREERFSDIKTIDEYREQYNLLSPELKPYFATPENIQEQQAQNVQVNVTKVSDRVKYYEDRNKALEEQRRIEHERYLNLSGDERVRQAKSHNSKIDNIDDKIDKNNQYINQWQRGVTLASQGFTYESINDQVSANVEGWQSRKLERRELNKRVESGEIVVLTTPSGIKGRVVGVIEGEGKGIRPVVPKQFEGKKRIPIKDYNQYVKESTTLKTSYEEIPQERIQLEPDVAIAKKRSKTDEKIKAVSGEVGRVTKYIYTNTIGGGKIAVSESIRIASKVPLLKILGQTSYRASKDVINIGKDIYNKIPDTPIRTGFGVTAQDTKENTIAQIDTAIQKAYERDVEKAGIIGAVTPKYEGLFQSAFESKYKEGIEKGEITFEEAQTEFLQSEEAIRINEEYNKEIAERRSDRLITTKIKDVEGYKIYGLSIAKMGINLLPTTYKGAVVTSIGAVLGYKSLKLIPSAVVTGSLIGSTAYGTYKITSPTSTPEDVAGGVITVGISGTILGVKGVKYLRKPTIRTEQIRVSKALTEADKQASVIAKRKIPVLDQKGNVIGTKRVYETSKLDEVVIQGRRTVISTKWRDILGVKPIYQGIPYSDPTGRAKALKILVKRGGLTTAQAEQTLRLYKPRAYILTTEGQTTLVSTDKNAFATFKGTQTIKPSIRYYPELDLKSVTGAVKTVKISATRTAIKDIGKDLLIRENIQIGNKLFETTRQIRITASAKLGAGQLTKLKSRGFIKGLNFNDLKKYVRSNTLVLDYPDELLMTDTRYATAKELRSLTQPLIRYRSLPQPVTLNFSEKELKFARSLERKQAIKRFIKDTRATFVPSQTPIPEIRQLAIENLQATAQPQNLILDTKLKTQLLSFQPATVTPTPSLLTIPNISTSVSNALSLGSALNIAQTQRPAIKNLTKLKLNVKNLLGTESKLKEETKLKEQLKTIQIQQPRSLLGTPQLSKLLSPTIDIAIPQLPTTTTPVTPLLKPITSPSIAVDFDPTRSMKGLKQKRLTQQVKYYLPDFTSRALGLTPEKITEKQAQKKLNQILTGLEIRRGVKLI